MAFTRRLNYLARKTLFRFGPFGWLIDLVDAIPIDRDGMGLAGLKETLRRLKRGEMVLIFPEGTRSQDGEISPLLPGFVALARRSRAPLLPVGVDGAFEAWPRKAIFPRPATIHVCFGEPISADRIRALSDEELIAEVEARLRACQAEARRSRST
jgi:1-acyl-sn-glycerol-3-phosphate acyltransferase